MLGGHLFQERLGNLHSLTQQEILAKAVEAVTRHLGISRPPDSSSVSIHRGCIPQYVVGHHAVLQGVKGALRRSDLNGLLSLTGASYLGVSVNDCIYRAKRLAFSLAAEQQNSSTTGLEALE